MIFPATKKCTYFHFSGKVSSLVVWIAGNMQKVNDSALAKAVYVTAGLLLSIASFVNYYIVTVKEKKQ